MKNLRTAICQSSQRLIRVVLNNSESDTIPLAEEIKALELYLELEAMRFENAFSFEITIDKNIPVNAIEIPSLLIQPYAENAVKHGMQPGVKDGKIKIGITQENDFIKCVIEDNGIGRIAAGAQKTKRIHKPFGYFYYP